MNRFALGLAVGAAATAAGAAGLNYLRGHRLINRHVDDYRAHWESRPQDHPEGVLHYVALGDSAAQGVGATHVGASYVSLLGERLASATGRRVSISRRNSLRNLRCAWLCMRGTRSDPSAGGKSGRPEMRCTEAKCVSNNAA